MTECYNEHGYVNKESLKKPYLKSDAPIIKDLPKETDEDVRLYRRSFSRGSKGILICNFCGCEAMSNTRDNVTADSYLDGWRVIQNEVTCNECIKTLCI